jgi:hypothetical protein
MDVKPEVPSPAILILGEAKARAWINATHAKKTWVAIPPIWPESQIFTVYIDCSDRYDKNTADPP